MAVLRAILTLVLSFGVLDRGAVASATPPVEDVVSAWATAREWVDRFSVPREHDGSAAVVLRDASALSLVLRADGAIVGRAIIDPVDGLALRRATGRAMSEALGSIRSAVEAGGDRVGQRLTLELEVAGAPTPLLGRNIAEAARRIRPGIDGIALRRGERWAFAFPGRLLATNTAQNPAATIGSLATDLDLPVRDLPDLKEIDDVALYRFDTVRLVQLGPGESPTTLLRGDEVVTTASVTRERAARLAADVAARLIRTAHRDAKGEPAKWFRGTYRALADDHRPPVAPVFEQALCCLALLRLAESPALDGLPRAERELIAAECRETALSVLETLAIDPPAVLRGSEGDVFDQPRSAAAVALAVMATERAGRAPWLEQLLEWTLGRLDDTAVPTSETKPGESKPTGSADDDDPHADPFDGARASTVGGRAPLDQALVAAALAHAARHGERGVETPGAVRAVTEAWASVAPDQRVSLLPWLAWAERDLEAAEADGAGDDAPDGEPAPAVAERRELLIELREQVLAVQAGFGEGLTEVAPDVVGGFVFVGRPAPFAPPEVTAQSLRPLAGLAVLLAESTLTPEPAREPLWRRQLAGLRYLTQLAVRPPVDALARRPAAARWGIRQATWDSEQPAAAQAMAILTLVDSLAAWPAPSADEPVDPP